MQDILESGGELGLCCASFTVRWEGRATQEGKDETQGIWGEKSQVDCETCKIRLHIFFLAEKNLEFRKKKKKSES